MQARGPEGLIVDDAALRQSVERAQTGGGIARLRQRTARPTDAEMRREFVNRGFRVIPIRYGHPIEPQIAAHPDIFGARSGI
jgi:hypothetical protein